MSDASGAGVGARVARGAAAVAVATLAVRLLGLVKESALAAAFGASAEMDALSLALLVPATLGTLLAGSLPLALIPAFFAERERNGEKAADRFFAAASTVTVLVLGVLSAALALAAEPIARLCASGFAPEKVALTARLVRDLALVLALSGVVACLRSRLFAAERFFVGAFGPAFISAAVLVAVSTGLARTVEGVALAILAGYVAKSAYLAISLRRARLPLPFDTAVGGGAGRFFRESVPIVVGAGIVSLNPLIDQAVASRLADGSVASLRFADQVLQIPIALVAMAVSTAVFPRFARLAASGDVDALRASFSSAVRSVLLVALPAAAVLVAAPDVVISLLFERGAFDSAATAAAAAPLRVYGLVLPFLAYGFVNGRAYNAIGRNGVLVKVAAATLAANLALDLLLVGPFGTVGIAAATVVAQGGAAAVLYGLLRRSLGSSIDVESRRAILRGAGSSVALGLLVFAVRGGVPALPGRALVVVGAAVPATIALALLFHRAEISSLVAALRRRS